MICSRVHVPHCGGLMDRRVVILPRLLRVEHQFGTQPRQRHRQHAHDQPAAVQQPEHLCLQAEALKLVVRTVGALALRRTVVDRVTFQASVRCLISVWCASKWPSHMRTLNSRLAPGNSSHNVRPSSAVRIRQEAAQPGWSAFAVWRDWPERVRAQTYHLSPV